MRIINEFLKGGLKRGEKFTHHNYNDWVSGKNKKLIIVGLSGSGKTTLGKKLSKKYKCPVYSTDSMFQYFIKTKTKYNPKEIDKKIQDAIVKEPPSKRVIFEGVHPLWLDFNVISKYPIIVMSTPVLISSYRAIIRELPQGGMDKENIKELKSLLINHFQDQIIFFKRLREFKRKIQRLK